MSLLMVLVLTLEVIGVLCYGFVCLVIIFSDSKIEGKMLSVLHFMVITGAICEIVALAIPN